MYEWRRLSANRYARNGVPSRVNADKHWGNYRVVGIDS
jgi:hypothetical protein